MKETLRKVSSAILLLVMIVCFILIGTREYKSEQSLSSQDKITQEYPNLTLTDKFNYLNNKELEEFLANGSGILFLANPDSIWSESYAIYLSEFAQENNVTINYFNIAHAKETSSRIYLNLVEKLKNQLITTDMSSDNLFTPMTIYINNGEAEVLDNTTAIMPNQENPKDYWTNEKIAEFKQNFMTTYKLMEEGNINGSNR